MYILMWSAMNYEKGVIGIYRTRRAATIAALLAATDEIPAYGLEYELLHAEYGQYPTFVTSWNFGDLKEKDDAS